MTHTVFFFFLILVNYYSISHTKPVCLKSGSRLLDASLPVTFCLFEMMGYIRSERITQWRLADCSMRQKYM